MHVHAWLVIFFFILDIICTYHYIPLEGIFLFTMFAMYFMVHTPTQHTLAQLLFGEDVILNINLEAKGQLIK